MARYKVFPISQSAHCCFEATVVDSTKPKTYFDPDINDFHHETICECFSIEDAQLVCDALNAREEAKRE